jgi:hypothetical protein
MHQRSAQGYLDNMLSGDIDGAEYHFGRGDAARLWIAADMARKRAAAVADVDATWMAGC